MNNVNQFLLDTNNALTSYDNLKGERYINTDEFNATIKFNDLWNEAHQEIADKYSLPSFHLWESGFTQGDATNEELIEVIEYVNKIEYENGANEVNMGNAFGPTVTGEEDEDGNIQTDLFEYLCDKLLETVEPKVALLIEEYRAFCKSKLEEFGIES